MCANCPIKLLYDFGTRPAHADVLPAAARDDGDPGALRRPISCQRLPPPWTCQASVATMVTAMAVATPPAATITATTTTVTQAALVQAPLVAPLQRRRRQTPTFSRP